MRDRDESGRARNARPRDAYGRPLPRGSVGEPTMPDDLDLPPDEALIEAQRLLDADRPFHAHEVLEAVWKAAPEPERELWRGLAQVAVGITHLRRGNPRGAHALLSRAADRLEPYAANPPHNIDVPGIIATTRSLATATPEPTVRPAEPAAEAATVESAATAGVTAAEVTEAAATTEPAVQPAAGAEPSVGQAEPSVGPAESSAGPGETTAEPATAAKAATAESAASGAGERDATPEQDAARSTDSHEERRNEAPSRAHSRLGEARAKDGTNAQVSHARRRDEAPSQADTKHETDPQGSHAQKHAIRLRLTR